MILCLCNGLREADVRQAARGHARSGRRPSVARLYRSINACIDCGMCVKDVRGIIHDECVSVRHAALPAE